MIQRQLLEGEELPPVKIVILDVDVRTLTVITWCATWESACGAAYGGHPCGLIPLALD
jgi:hypothetical protein